MSLTTLGDLRTDVRSRIAEPVPRFFSNDELNRWINLALHDYCSYVQPLKYYLAFTIPVAGKATFNMPNNNLGIERINWAEAWPLEHLSEMEWRAKAMISPFAQNVRPQQYMNNPPFGNVGQFQVWPGPSVPSVSVVLASNISATDTTITSTTPIPAGGFGFSASTFSTQGYFWIGTEQVRFWGIDPTGYSFLNCERGSAGTGTPPATLGIGQAHLAGVSITYAPMQVLYRYDPDDLVSDSDPVPFSSRSWHEALVCYASAQAFLKQKLQADAKIMLDNYNRIRDEAKLVREREGQDKPMTIFAVDPAEQLRLF